MDFLRIISSVLLLSIGVLLSSCQIGYLLKSATGQLSLISRRIPIKTALEDPKIPENEKDKIRLAQEARQFGEQYMGLTPTKNYTDFVPLDQPYVTYVVSAAPMWELKHYLWDFPFVGEIPYKGFFKEVDAKEEEARLKKKNLDTYLRGVSAYSTLGWFKDPLLSSMMNYENHALVNTIIHESVHATLYIKSSADFNERLAVFLGNTGTEAFYLKKEGPDSPTLKIIKNENYDEKIFSKFITKEILDLEKWYKTISNHDVAARTAHFEEIQMRFKKKIKPQLKTKMYSHFDSIQLNNAQLLIYKTYIADLSEFSKLFDILGHDFHKFIEKCKTLEKDPDPEKGLIRLQTYK